ncbi:MAG: hydrogenase maturation nickel metallochaperone HypA [Clostridiales bacterium]|nr:hydrogenase maturation nickel metallochaperone HypA [Clostridiales bacterium]
MHELGLVSHVIKTVERICREQSLRQVCSVTLEIGEVSGVIPDYLTDCWYWSCKKTVYLRGAALRFETIPAVTLCENCGCQYPTVTYAKICPSCHSVRTHLLRGNELIIKEIEAE